MPRGFKRPAQAAPRPRWVLDTSSRRKRVEARSVLGNLRDNLVNPKILQNYNAAIQWLFDYQEARGLSLTLLNQN